MDILTLKQACISRDGVVDGAETYKDIIDQCRDVAESGNYFEIEEILHDEGFEPDYVFDVLEAII